MELLVGDIDTQILNPRSCTRGLSIVREVCRARPNGYQFMPKYRQHVWDGYITLMPSLTTFPSGLLSRVQAALAEAHIEVNVRYETEVFPVPGAVFPEDLQGITLRGYQVDAANDLLKAGRGIAHMATNSGKTEVMAAMLKALGIPRSLILLHRKELMYQTAARFNARLGVEIGMIGDGIWREQLITVAMIQTLSARFHEYEPAGNKVLMVDECHHASAARMLGVLRLIPGKYRFGFSGTPLKDDVLSDMRLMAYTGDVISKVSNQFMIDNEYSAKPYIRISVVEEFDKNIWKLSYSDAYDTMIVKNDVHNKRIRNYAQESAGTVLILVEHLEHGRILNGLIANSIFVNGSDTTEYRQGVLERMRSGKGIYIATSIFDEGVDVPNISTLILAGGGKNYARILQRIGRGLRRKEDNRLIVYDFIDDTNKYLLDQSSKRIKTYVNEGFETDLVRL